MHLLSPALLILLACAGSAAAHEWHRESLPPPGPEREALREHMLEEWNQAHQQPAPVLAQPVQIVSNISSISALRLTLGAAEMASKQAPLQAGVFQKFPKLQLRWDADFLYIGSNGMPDHSMMVGITNWQQQVPLPHPYYGDNAWRVPLHPVVAKQSASIKGRFLRGAIALAVNGIPIFNPQNNRGEVSQEIGELDQWGGHCGRADDYHYHAAPLHLQSVVGKGQPIAYALDGYPIYGLTEPDGAALGKLDECNGHDMPGLGYHYHASTKYPYVNGGFHGVVVEAGGQVDPQPRANGVRRDGEPLRGAKITGFENVGANGYKLTYEVGGEKRVIAYSINTDGTYPFEYQNGSSATTKEVYTERQGGGGGPGGGGGGGPRERSMTGGGDQPRRGPGGGGGRGGPPPQGGPGEDRRRGPGGGGGGEKSQATAQPSSIPSQPGPKTSFVLSSSAVADGGALPVEFTGDGAASSPPLAWKGAPAGTKGYALIMHHLDPEGVTKVYWALYNIPANTAQLDKNVQGIGTLGLNTVNNRTGYAPPHSKGPGAKTYILTLFALSAPPQISADPSQVTGEMLAAALKDRTLATTDLSVVYTRSAASGSQSENEGQGQGQGRRPPMRESESSGGQPPAAPPPRPGESGSGGPQAGGGGRKPWLQQHGAELDADHDGIISLSEMADDMKHAFAMYDLDKNSIITQEELLTTGDQREGAAFAGLIYRHFADLDTNHDGSVSREEMVAAAKYIFNSADADHDGNLSTAEWQAAPNAPLPARYGDSRGGPSPAPPAQ